MQTTCSSPAKLILSGEHAVVYGCPALSMAINISATCDCSYTSSTNNQISLELTNYGEKHCLPNLVWHKLASDIESRFALFEANTAAIHSVLSKPIDLILVTLHHFDLLHPIKAGEWSFKIHSEIPTGRGLGSSAAIIIGLLKTLYEQHHIEVENDTLLALAQRIEARQHGQSSGIDPATIIHGGLLEFQSNQPIKRHHSHKLQGWLIDTGQPQSTTGQAVFYVKQHHQANHTLWKAFEENTKLIIEAWDQEQVSTFLEGIQKNQTLLEDIGVVPHIIQTFIRTLNDNLHATAKVCGAGSVSGEQAGIVLCFCEHSPEQLCQEFGYDCEKFEIHHQGATCLQT